MKKEEMEEMEEMEFFKVRPLGTEKKGFIITAGNMMASKKHSRHKKRQKNTLNQNRTI